MISCACTPKEPSIKGRRDHLRSARVSSAGSRGKEASQECSSGKAHTETADVVKFLIVSVSAVKADFGSATYHSGVLGSLLRLKEYCFGLVALWTSPVRPRQLYVGIQSA